MGTSHPHSIKATIRYLGSHLFLPLWARLGGDLSDSHLYLPARWRVRIGGAALLRRPVLLLLLTLFMSAVIARAQTAPIPNPNWPLDSVINGAVKLFTVQGDLNYNNPSTFTWVVYGGRLFYDEALTQPAGDGTTATVVGDSATNITQIWVIWDVFTQPIDYGWIYVTEVSADGCEKPDIDENKYQGLNIKVKAPPIFDSLLLKPSPVQMNTVYRWKLKSTVLPLSTLFIHSTGKYLTGM